MTKLAKKVVKYSPVGIVGKKLLKDDKKKPVDPYRVRKPSKANVANVPTVFSSNSWQEEE